MALKAEEQHKVQVQVQADCLGEASVKSSPAVQ